MLFKYSKWNISEFINTREDINKLYTNLSQPRHTASKSQKSIHISRKTETKEKCSQSLKCLLNCYLYNSPSVTQYVKNIGGNYNTTSDFLLINTTY